MSRSYKKPWRKDKSNGFKQICSRAHRRIARQTCKRWRYKYYRHEQAGCYGCECIEWYWEEWEAYKPVCDFHVEPMEPMFPLRKELVDQYTICDWKYYNPNEPRNFRK